MTGAGQPAAASGSRLLILDSGLPPVLNSTVLFLIAHGAGLFWLLVNPERIRDKPAIRVAWFCYVGALLPGAFAFHWIFLLLAWGLIVTSACFLFVAIDPAVEKRRKKKDREYEPIMPLSQMPDENPPTVPPPVVPPEI